MPKPKRRKFEIKRRQKRREKRVLVTHHITSWRGIDPFTSLKKIISEGFKKKSPPNVNITKVHEWRYSFFGHESNLEHTKGDEYRIEMLTQIKRQEKHKGTQKRNALEDATVTYAHPAQIKTIIIKLNPQLKVEDVKRRKQFYRKEFPDMPIEFVKERYV